MNPVIRAQLREYATSNLLTTHAPDKQFEIYSIFSVMNGLLGENIDAYEVHLEGDEFGVDGIAVVIQGEIACDRQEAKDKLSATKNPSVEFIFFQAKTGTNYDYGDISKFFDAVSGFFNGQLAGESAAVDDLIGAREAVYESGIGKRNPKISCYYITTGNYEEPARIQKLRSTFCDQLKEMNIFEVNGIKVELVGARELQQWYRSATTSSEVVIEFPRNVVMPINSHVEEAYIGYIDASNLLKLFVTEADHGKAAGINRAVFFDNIRDYDAKSAINLGIKESVRTGSGAEFVFRNNGITVVSKNIDRTGDKFKLEDFQIVNGCQTSNIVFDLVYGETGIDNSENAALADAIQVPFRLIGSKDDDFVSSIIVGTNRQNPVRDDQFWALRPFMKSLEEYCRNLEQDDIIFLERRDNQYRNQEVERTRIMQPSVLTRAVAACLLFQPQRANRDYRGILAEYGSFLFLDSQDVRIYHAAAYLYYKLEFLWRNQRIDNSLKIFRYFILAGIGLRVTDAQNVFTMKSGQIPAVAEKFLKICKDEEKLKMSVTKVVQVIEDRLQELGVTGQERIRDAIRSETFSTSFRDKIRALRDDNAP